MHVKITNLIINFVTKLGRNGLSASMFGLEQRQKVVLAAKIGLEERWNVAWEQDWPGGSRKGRLATKICQKVTWKQGLACKVARMAPGRKDCLEDRQKVAQQLRLA